MFMPMDSSSSSSMDRTRTRRTTSPSSSAIQTCLDSQLWHACAGPMVQMPPLNTKVLYFPQGHAEHQQAHAHGRKPHFAPTMKTPIPPFFPCTLTAIKYMAEPETDEVYVKITLTPLTQQHHLSDPEEHDHHCSSNHNNFLDNNNNVEKPASFAKTLTQSDANNGGGFSVPRYCAETIFPRLDYSAEPPVQTIIAKDVHGQCWKFRHIYRGTPRRHLLTTGWSNFVNHKKLVAGDSIVFLRAENGDLCVGIRRAKKGGIGAGTATNTTTTTTTDQFWKNNNVGYGGGECYVGEAVNCAVNGRAFEVVYYPRGSSPEFCVKASSVRASMQIQWCSGMRFKMPFETEDSSRISWFMGTISSVQVSDPLHWPHSPWRLLQVVWDEPDLLQNVKCVNPWLVELVSNVPNFHLSPFSPARKKQRFLQDQPDFQLINQIPIPFPPASSFSTNLCNIQDHHSFSQGIQGARHAHQFGLAPQDFHILDGFPRLDHAAQQPDRPSFGIYHKNNAAAAATKNNNNLEISCLLSVGNPGQSFNKEESCSNETKAPHILLFGKLIHTDQQNNSSNSSNSVYEGTNSSLKTSIENSSDDGGSPWFKNQHKNNDLVGTENINILCMAL